MNSLNVNSLQYDVSRVLDMLGKKEVNGTIFADGLGRVNIYITKDDVKVVIPDINFNRVFDYESLMLSNMYSVILKVIINRLNVEFGFVNFSVCTTV